MTVLFYLKLKIKIKLKKIKNHKQTSDT